MSRPTDMVSAAIEATAERWRDLCSAGPGGHVAALIALRDAVNNELAARGHTQAPDAATTAIATSAADVATNIREHQQRKVAKSDADGWMPTISGFVANTSQGAPDYRQRLIDIAALAICAVRGLNISEDAETDARESGTGPDYYCPTSGETESATHGGFDVCCDRPDLHQPIKDGAPT